MNNIKGMQFENYYHDNELRIGKLISGFVSKIDGH